MLTRAAIRFARYASFAKMPGMEAQRVSNTNLLSVYEARLTLIQSAITATLTRNASAYSTEVQSLTSLGIDKLRDLERDMVNEIDRLQRGSRFGPIGFKRISQ